MASATSKSISRAIVAGNPRLLHIARGRERHHAWVTHVRHFPRGRSRGNFCGLAVAGSARKSPAMQKTRRKTRSLNMPDRQFKFNNKRVYMINPRFQLTSVNSRKCMFAKKLQ